MSTIVAALNLQTVVDGVGIGAIYALMAVGIGLVFGVLRLVNFAYGQLIMAGAFTLALASEWDWPAWAGIVLATAQQHYLYRVRDRQIVAPNAVEFTDDTPRPIITLITCYPDGVYSHRLIVRAEAVA